MRNALACHSKISRLRYVQLAWLICGTLACLGQNSAPAAAAVGKVIPQNRVDQISKMLRKEPAGFGIPCSDRAAWDPLKARFASQTSAALTITGQSIKAWDDDAYLDFSKTGSRTRGEAMLTPRQDALTSLVLAECVDGGGKLIPRIAELVDSLAAEPSWTLPASDTQLDSFSGRRHFVDLNAAILANEIAEVLYLLGDKLPDATRKHAMDALEVRVFAPMRVEYTTGAGEPWVEWGNNLNAVCLNGVTGAALSVLPGREDRALFVAGAEQYHTHYLVGFMPDGYAVEGIGYWDYGMESFAGLREHVWQATGGQIDWFRDPLVASAALFGLQFQMLPGIYADFGDSKFGQTPSPELIAYLEYVFRIPDPATHKLLTGTEAMPTRGEIVADALVAFPLKSQLTDTSKANLADVRTFYPLAKVLVARPGGNDKMAITVKAGGNITHSHNDIGSFSIGLEDTQVLGDPGGPNFYTAATFSDKRLQSPLLNSYGHPVPMIGGQLELDATKVKAEVTQTSFTPDLDSIAIDMTPAYTVPGLKHFDRTVRYSRQGAGAIDIIDNFVLTNAVEIEESLPTHGTWQKMGDKEMDFTYKGRLLKVSVATSSPVSIIDSKPVSDYGNSFTRVRVWAPLKTSGTIAFHITPGPSQ